MIDKSNPYFKQAELVVQVLPLIAKYDCFALKGGTAINLFVQNMPRLSVDMDLTYLPVQQRDESLANIENTLKQIATDIKKYVQKVDGKAFRAQTVLAPARWWGFGG